MRHRTRILVLLAITGAAACGGASATDFETPGGGAGANGGKGSGGGAGLGGSGNAPSAGGTKSAGGTSGTGGDAAGGTDATGGTTGGTGGDAVGGTDAAGGATGGTSGDAAGGSGGTAGDAMGGLGGTAGDLMAGSSGTAGDAMGGSTATGGTTGGTAMTGGSGGTGGTSTTDCAALATDYAMTLEEAEACNPDSGKDQCTAMQRSSLVCGCNVYVNPDNKDAVAHLDELRKQSMSMHCMMACPAIACVMPGGATCQRTGESTGRCTSVAATPF